MSEISDFDIEDKKTVSDTKRVTEEQCSYYFFDGYCKQLVRCSDDCISFNKCNGVCGNFFPLKQKPSRYISKSTRYEVLNRQHWVCNICGCRLKYSNENNFPGEVAHIDHIHPFSEWETYKGYINNPSNLEALCPSCNMKKHSKTGF